MHRGTNFVLRQEGFFFLYKKNPLQKNDPKRITPDNIDLLNIYIDNEIS
jgi:hypothetical protein